MKSRNFQNLDYFILFSAIILVVVGFVMLSSASSPIGLKNFESSTYYVKHQMINGLIPGLALFLFTYFFYYKRYKKISFLFYLFSIVILVLVFTPLGSSAGGAAYRWINLGTFSFQPAELVKLLHVIYMAAWLSRKPKLIPFLLINGIIAALLLMQPSLSNAIILMASVFLMYFASGTSWKNILIVLIISAILLSSYLILRGGYQVERITTYIKSKLGSSGDLDRTSDFQRAWSVIAIGSGGLQGIGYGESSIKSGPLPEAIGDSIFAVIAQELGFTGSVILIALFVVLVFGGLLLANKVTDKFGKLLIIGIVAVIGLQAFINMAALSGLIPITGVPLPFISYGGTSFATMLAGIGIMLNVSKYGR